MDNPRSTCITDSPCGDPTCYRGAVGGWNYQFKDGPCAAPDCAWPKGLPARPHFTDTPATPIVDAGRVAREQRAADVAADVHAQQICAAEDRHIMRAITEPMTRPPAVSPRRMTATDVNRTYQELQRQIRKAFR